MIFLIILSVFFCAPSSQAIIQLNLVETPSGVHASYSGTWDVTFTGNPGGTGTRPEPASVVADFFGILFLMNGSPNNSFSQYEYGESGLIAFPTEGVFTVNPPSSQIVFSDNSPVGTPPRDSFGLLIDPDVDRIEFFGPSSGSWVEGDSLSGSAFYAGATLGDLGLIPESGGFTAGGQTLNYDFSIIPEPSSFGFLMSLFGLSIVLGIRRRDRDA
ncbi:MAG: hypothetical protein AAGJ81_14320 [Verrucomicrobiota bacterium]